MSLIDQLRENPSTLEFLAHPDLRQVCTFFLGATFFSAAVGITQSRAFGRLQVLLDQLLFPRRRQPFVSLESPNEQPRHLEVPPTGTPSEKLRDWSGRFPLSEAQLRVDPLNLLFFLTLFVALAALSLFGSVLQFSSTTETGCAFIVAWAGLSSQCVRIIGLFHLSLELQNVGARRMEKYMVWIVLFLSFVLMFVTNALSTGTLREVKAVPGYFLCYRRHFAPTAIITSIINILLEIWLLVRFFMLAVPKFFRVRDQLGSLYDGRLRKGGSLLLLDLLTLVPSAIPVAITADIIPFCVGALFVLAAFNRVPKSNGSDALTFSIPPSTTQSHIGTFVTQVRSPLSETNPSTSPVSTTVHFARPSLSPSNGQNRSSMLSIPPAPPPKRPQLAHILTSGSYNMSGHPYAAGDEPEYVRPHERISVLSSDSAVAQSVAGAVVSFAFHQGNTDRSSMAPLPTGLSNRASMYSPPTHDRPAGFTSFPPPPRQARRVSYLDIQETPVVSPLASPPSFIGSSNASDMRTISSRVPSSRRGGPPIAYDPRRLHPSYLSMEDSASDDSRPTAPSFISQEPRPTAPSIMSEDALSFSDALQRPPPTLKRDPLPGSRVADIRQMHRVSVGYSDHADPAQNASHRLSPLDVPYSPSESVMSSPDPLPLDPRGIPLYRD